MNDLLNENFLFEELSDEQKEYVRQLYAKSGAKKDLPHDNTHDEFFERYTGNPDAHKMIIPYSRISSEEDATNMVHSFEHHAIEKVLRNNGYQMHDFVNNVATETFDTPFGKKTRSIKISKVLQNLPEDKKKIPQRDIDYHALKVDNYADLYSSSAFKKASNKAADQLQIVISRHRDDLGAMSTGRNWESCMTLPTFDKGIAYDGGINHKKIVQDFKHHTLIAYLTKKGDDTATEPLGRTLVKKFVDKEGHEIYRPSFANYGDISNGVSYILNSHFQKNYPAKDNSDYEMHPDLYPDNIGRTRVSKEDEKTGYINEFIEDMDNPHVLSHTVNKDGLLHSEDGKTPSLIVSHESPDGRKYETHFVHKYGTLHSDDNYPTKTVYKIEDDGSKKLIGLKRHFYGMLHSTKDELPSSETYLDKGNESLVSKTWHKYNSEYVSPYHGVSKIQVTHDKSNNRSEIHVEMNDSFKNKSKHIDDPLEVKITTKNNDVHVEKSLRGSNFKQLTENLSYKNNGEFVHTLRPTHFITDFTHIPRWTSNEGYSPVILNEDEYKAPNINTYEDFKKHINEIKKQYLALNEK